MSKVTLETLRADFEAAIDCLIFGVLVAGRWDNNTCSRLVAALEIAKRRPELLGLCDGQIKHRASIDEAILKKARILAVAEKDGLEAAMLWKLAN